MHKSNSRLLLNLKQIPVNPYLMKLPFIYTSLLFIVFLGSCAKTTTNIKENSIDSTSVSEETEKPVVEVFSLKPSIFEKEIISNGKLTALRKADLKFRVSELIEKIYVHNGQRVEKGALLASVEKEKIENQLKRARANYEKAMVEMQDQLITMGYPTMDSTKIPPVKWKTASIKSGLQNATLDLENALYDYRNTTLSAPFSGVVSNLKVKESNLSTQDIFCTLIDNTVFEAEFQVMEPELEHITINQRVLVTPFAVDTTAIQGSLSEINPVINENGLVTVKARVKNISNKLVEGMNVRLIIIKNVSGMLVVPKQAVVQRQGKNVLFTAEEGRAKWHYVRIVDENSASYAVTEDDDNGEISGRDVIISNNLNIAHNAEIDIISE